MMRILLTENKALHPHRMRDQSRRSGLFFLYDSAGTAAEFQHMLQRRPAMVLCTPEGLEDMEERAIVAAAHKAEVPVLMVGGDSEAERALVAERRSSYTATIRRARVPWAPMLIDRLMRERQHRAERADALRMAEELREQEAMRIRETQKMALVGRLAGSIAHEINNPLESVTNLMWLMRTDEHVPAHLRAYLELAEQELGRVVQISKQTLTFYREAQEPSRVRLSALMEEVLVLYQRRLADRRITVECRYGAEEPVLVCPGEMRQVYANLVANAIEAVPEGGRIVVRIHRGRRWRGRGASEGMRVTVADSGCGMPEAVRRRLGQPFYTTKGEQGTGLGLWVSQAIVRRVDGDMQVRSADAGRGAEAGGAERGAAETGTVPRGTTFSIFVPFEQRSRVVEIAAHGQRTAAEPGEVVRLRASSN